MCEHLLARDSKHYSIKYSSKYVYCLYNGTLENNQLYIIKIVIYYKVVIIVHTSL